MKPLRVLSPIEPGELCWVRVDGVWWLVRAEGEGLRGCDNCCLHGTNCFIPCESARQDIAFSRVHPIPMPAKAADVLRGEVYGNSLGKVYKSSDEKEGEFYTLSRIGPPEE